MPKVLLYVLSVTAIAGLMACRFNQAEVSRGFIAAETASIEPVEQTEQTAVSVTTGDRILHPPVRQTFTRGPYQLVINAEDQWQTPAAIGELYEGDILRWQKALPHQYGPRFAVIGQTGQVLLIDEFINVASPHALTLMTPDGKIVKRGSFQDIEAVLQVTPAELTQQATSGWWVATPPTVSDAGDRAFIQAGGTLLEIDLTTGNLSRREL